MQIVFDLDGVIRDLYGPMMKEDDSTVVEYDWKNKEGLSVCDLIEQKLERLEEAPVTEYYKLIKYYINFTYSPIEIWSHQLPHWQKYTERWINTYFATEKIKLRFLNSQEKYKLLYYEDKYIVEDYPFFPSYDRVILIDRPYNRNCKANTRIQFPYQLKEFLKWSKQ